MVLNVCLVLFLVVFLSLIINAIEDYHKKPSNTLSFDKELLVLTELPIVKVISNGKEFHFVLDSGAAHSTLNMEVLDEIDNEVLDEVSGTAYGIDGNPIETAYANVNFSMGNQKFTQSCQILDLSYVSASLKNKCNIHFAGLLGSDFFLRYKCVLDFNKMEIFNVK